jgi:quercetin dioxygenase-like cupin family protein
MSEKKILKDCIANSKDLSSLVEYSEDSVVSKTLIDKSAGTVTLFAFDKDQSLSEHTTPYDALVQVLDGEGIFVIDGEPVHCTAGGVLIMPADVPHSVKAAKRFKMMLVMIREK